MDVSSTRTAGNNGEWDPMEVAPGQQLSDYLKTTPTNNEIIKADPDKCTTVIQLQDKLADGSGMQGVCGLRNIGNTCYMNAGLQCIMHCAQIVKYYLMADSKADDFTITTTNELALGRLHLVGRFSTLMKKLWSGQYSCVHPKLFKTTLGLVYPQFSGSRQQDCQEFLALLLDSLHEHSLATGTSIITNTFQGLLRNKVVCSNCNHVSNKVEPFVYLSIPLPGAFETQLEFYWVPFNEVVPRHVTRMMVTVLKNQTILDLKKVLCDTISRPGLSNDMLVVAEILKGSLSRFLSDNLPVKQIACGRGELLYVFEMVSPNQVAARLLSSDNMSLSEGQVQENNYEVVQWHSCAVCLEELLDSELLTHKQCGGVICTGCLGSSAKHYEKEGRFACPICQVSVSQSDGFTPLITNANLSSTKSVTSFLQVYVMLRGVDSEEILGHPSLLHLPRDASGDIFYKALAVLIPTSFKRPWVICFTGPKGKYCSRCVYGSNCKGCELKAETSYQLRPGDFLTISFSEKLSAVDIEELARVVVDPAIDQLKKNPVLKLEDCLQAFSKSELLADDNPWHCPQCKGLQQAHRTLSISSLPSILVIHLKRFAYHGSGSKLDATVEFPMTLSVSKLLDGTDSVLKDQMQLIGVVCHFGSIQCGHYTAFCRHPINGSWSYYNDETISEKSPSSADTESVYMLFYERIGSEYKPTGLVPANLRDVMFDDNLELKTMEQLLHIFKPVAQKACPSDGSVDSKQIFKPTLKRARSESDMQHIISKSTVCRTATLI